MTDLIDSILAEPRPKRNHPGGTKGRGTRGGRNRDEKQVKCACNAVEHAAFTEALRKEFGKAVSPALRDYLIRLAKKHNLLANSYEV